jgi:hypothetical protein
MNKFPKPSVLPTLVLQHVVAETEPKKSTATKKTSPKIHSFTSFLSAHQFAVRNGIKRKIKKVSQWRYEL